MNTYTYAEYLRRLTPQYYAWRESVYQRDHYTCQDCGCRRPRCRLNAHHIKSYLLYPHLRYEVSNGVTLCRKCHARRHNVRP